MGEASLAGRPIAVTGASGFLGRHLVKALATAGAHVHALSCRRVPDLTEGISWHCVDLAHLNQLTDVMQHIRPSIVFNLAAYGTTPVQPDRESTVRTNILGSWHLWQALDGVRCRLVHAGSGGEYGPTEGLVQENHVCRPTSLYAATKNASVVLLTTLGLESGREVVVLRPFGPYGPADRPERIIPYVIRRLLANRPVEVSAGDQLRDYTYVDDHIAALLLAATRQLSAWPAIYNIGSGTCITLRSLIERIADLIDGESHSLLQFGAREPRIGDVPSMCGDIAAARRDLGYAPCISLDEGLARTVSWYRERDTER